MSIIKGMTDNAAVEMRVNVYHRVYDGHCGRGNASECLSSSV
ncbi:hypothetical protein [Virgibacillus halodenitrificans]